MSIEPSHHQRWLVAAAALLLGLVPAVWLTAQEAAEPQAGEAADPTESEVIGFSPELDPSIEWVLEEETGRRYTITKIPKVERTYRWIDDERIRLPGGTTVQVMKHDEESFWVKVYEYKRLRPRTAPEKPAPDEPAPLPDVDSADRIELKAFSNGLPRSGQWRNGFDVADMNGDGELDIVFGPSRKGRAVPNIFLGDGAGNWRRWNEAVFPRLPYDYGDAEAADFNGDGHMDLAFGVHLRGMLLVVSDGEGGFQPWSEGIEFDLPGSGGDATSFSSRAITSFDWDDDGMVDVLALGEGPKGQKAGPTGTRGPLINSSRGFRLYRNNGDGTWETFAIEEEPRDFGDNFAYGDFDANGLVDLAVASRLQGNAKPLRSRQKRGEPLASRALSPLRPNVFLTAVDAADLDGDGDDDLVVGYRNREGGRWQTGIDVYYSHLGTRDEDADDGEWTRRDLYRVNDNRVGIPALGTGDLDGDGRPDIVALSGTGQTLVFLGAEDGFFVAETSAEPAAGSPGCEGAYVHLVDVDGDGRSEVIAAFAGEPTGGSFGIPGSRQPGCPGRGRIDAWKAVAKPVAAADSAVGETAPGR